MPIDPQTNLIEPPKPAPTLGRLPSRRGARPSLYINPSIRNQFTKTTDPGEEYDFSIRIGEDADERRALEQPLLEKGAKGIGRIINSGLHSLAEGVGLAYGVGSAIANGDATKIYDNALLDAIDSSKEFVEEGMLEVYVPPSVQNGDFFDKISSLSFWTTDAADTLGFALAMMVPGQAVKALKVGEALNATKAGMAIENAGTKAARALKTPSKFKPGWLTGATNSTSAVAINTAYEAGSEARHTYTDLYDQMIKSGKSIDEAKEISGKAAASVFKANLAILALSNTLFERFVFKGFNANPGDDIIRASKGNILEQGKDALTKLTKADTAKYLAKGSLGAVISEGFYEEGFQFAAENFAKRKAKNETNDDWIEGILDTYASNIFKNTDMNISVFLGGLFGAGMTAIGTKAEIKNANELIFGNEGRKVSKLRKFLGGKDKVAQKGLADLLDTNIREGYKSVLDIAAKTTDTDGKTVYKLDENGNIEIDQQKLKKFLERKKLQHTILEHAAEAVRTGNETDFKYAHNLAAFHMMQEFLTNPYGESLLNKAIPEMAKLAAVEIQEMFSPEVELSVIESDMNKTLEEIKGITQKVNNNRKLDASVNEYTKDLSPEEQSLVLSEIKNAYTSALFNDQFIKANPPEFTEEQAEEKEKFFEKMKAKIDAFQNKDTLKKLINAIKKKIDSVQQSLKKHDIVEVDGKEQIVTEVEDGTATIVDAEGNETKIEDNGEVISTFELEEDEVVSTFTLEEEETELTSDQKVSNFIENFKRRDSSILQAAFLSESKVKTFLTENAENPKLIDFIINLPEGAIKKKLLSYVEEFIDEEGPMNNKPVVSNSTNTGRTPEDFFMPMSMNTALPPSFPNNANYMLRYNNAVAASSFFDNFRDRLDEFYIRIQKDEKVDEKYKGEAMEVVVMKDGKPVDVNGNNVEFGDPNSIVYPIPLASHKRASEAKNSTDPSLFMEALEEFQKIRSSMLAALSRGEILETSLLSTSSGVLTPIRRSNPKSIPEAYPNIAYKSLKLERNEQNTSRFPSGSILVTINGSKKRLFSKKLSKNHVETVFNAVMNSDSTTDLMKYDSIIGTLVYVTPKNSNSFIKIEGDNVIIREKVIPKSDTEKIKAEIARLPYQVYTSTNKAKKKGFTIGDITTEGEIINKETPSQSYEEYVLDNYTYTYDYPTEITSKVVNGKAIKEVNYARDYVYPRLDYHDALANPQTSGSEEYMEKDTMEKDVTVTGYVGRAKAGLTSVNSSTETDAVLTIYSDGTVEVADKAFRNVTRSLGAYFEFTDAITENSIVLEDPVFKEELDGTWTIVKRGKMGNARTITTENFVVQDRKAAAAWVSKNLPMVSLDFMPDLLAKGLHGYMHNASIVLDSNAEIGTVYHEAFHAFTQHLLTRSERKELYDLWKSLNNSNASDLEVEEALAEEFREYSLNQDDRSPFKKFFDWILRGIREMLSLSSAERNLIDQSFFDLYRGNVRKDLLTKTSRKFFRKSERFTNEEMDNLSNSLVGHILKKAFRHNANKTSVDATISTEEVDAAFKAMMSPLYETGRVKNSFDPNDKQRNKILLNKMKRDIILEKEAIIEGARIKLSFFDFQIEEEIDEALETDNKGYDKDDTQMSPIKSIPKRVRAMLGSFDDVYLHPVTGKKVTSFYPGLGVAKFLDAKAVFSAVVNTTAGSTNLTDIITTLEKDHKKFIDHHYLDFVPSLLERIGWKGSHLEVTPSVVDIQTEFIQAFANQTYDFNVYYASETALTYSSSVDARVNKEARTNWRSNFIANKENIELKERKVGNKLEKVWVHNRETHNELYPGIASKVFNEENYDDWIDYMEFLGIKLPIFFQNNGQQIPFDVLTNIVPQASIDELINNIHKLASYIEGHPDWIGNIHNIEYAPNTKEIYGAYKGLLKSYADFRGVVNENQFMDMNNNSRYTVGRHTFLSKQLADINKVNQTQNLSEKVEIVNNVFYDTKIENGKVKGSHVANMFAEGDLTEVSIETSMGIVNTSPEAQSNEFNDASVSEKLAINFNNLLNNRYPVIRPADNKQERVLVFKRNGEAKSIVIADKEVDQMFAYLSYAIETRDKYLRYGNLERVEDEHSIPFFNFLSEDLRRKLLINPTKHKAEFVTEFNTYTDAIVNENFEKLTKLRLLSAIENGNYINNIFHTSDVNPGNVLSKEKVEQLIKQATYGQMISVIEQTKMITGSPVFYSNADKFFKRMSGTVGPKSTSRVDQTFNDFLNQYHKRSDKKLQDGSIKIAVFEDPTSVYDLFPGDKPHDEADAVTFITNDFQREFSLRNGTWSFKQEIVYLHMLGKTTLPTTSRYWSEYRDYQEKKGRGRSNSIHTEDIGKNGFIIPPIKPQYFGKIGNKNGSRPGMVKTAFFNVDIMKDVILPVGGFMKDNQLDMITFPTAFKIGAPKKVNPLFKEDGSLNTDIENATIITGFHEYVGVQVSNQAKHKDEVSTGSQQAKIILDYIFDKGVARDSTFNLITFTNGQANERTMNAVEIANEYIKTHNAIHNVLFEDLMFKLGMFKNDIGEYELSESESNFIDSLRQQAEERGMSENTKSMIEDISEFGIESIPGNQTLQNVFFKMVDKAIVNAKTSGNGYFQHTSTLAKIQEGNTYTKDGKVFSGSDLKYYTKGEPMEIYLPWFMEGTVPENLSKEARELYGFRIPTQDINSLDAIRVKGFLPREAGNVVIVPTEYYKKNGSDSDGDKLFIHTPALNKDGSLISLEELTTTASKRNKLRLIQQNAEAYSEYKKSWDDIKNIELSSVMEYNGPLESEDDFKDMIADILRQSLNEEFDGRLKEVEKLDKVYSKIDYVFEKYNLQEAYLEKLEKEPDTLQSVKALQNKRLQISRTILLNEDNFENLTKPLDTTFFKDVAEELDVIRGKQNVKFHDFFNVSKVMDITEEYMQGKKGIGPSAVHRVSHVLTSLYDVYMETETEFPGLPQGEHSLGNKTNENGDDISAILSDLVNLFVDAVSDPMIKKLNLGIDTVNVAITLLRLGMSHRKVVFYLNQPIILEFLERRSALESNVLRARGVGESKFTTYTNILNEYSEGSTTLKSVENLTEEDLKNQLTNPDNATQMALLINFLGISNGKAFEGGWMNEAKAMRAFMSDTAQDRTSPGKNLAEFLVNNAMLGTHEKFSGLNRMFESDSFLGRYFKQYQTLIPTLGNFYMSANKDNLYNAYGILQPLKKEGISKDIQTRFLDSMFSSSLTYLLHEKGLNDKRFDLLYSDNSIAHRLQEMKNKYPNNVFLKTLAPSIQPDPNLTHEGEGILSGIIHAREKLSGPQTQMIVEAFESLIEDPETQQFGKDLAEAALLMYGTGNHPIGYSQYIPASYMKKLLRKYKINKNTKVPKEFYQIFIMNKGPEFLSEDQMKSVFKTKGLTKEKSLNLGLSEVNLSRKELILEIAKLTEVEDMLENSNEDAKQRGNEQARREAYPTGGEVPFLSSQFVSDQIDTAISELSPEEKTEVLEEENLVDEIELKIKVQETLKDDTKYKETIKKDSVFARLIKKIQNLIIPFVTGIMMFSSLNLGGYSDMVKPANFVETNLENIENVQLWQNEVNKMNDAAIIGAWYEKNSPNEQYMLLDKSNTRLHVMKGNEKLESFEVLIGKNKGDEQTVTTYDYNANSSNFMTGSGTYTVSRATEKNPGYYNQPSFNFTNAQGIEVPTSIHATPKNRLYRFDNNNEEDNRVSWGCLNGKCVDLNALFSEYKIDKGTKLHILPETTNAYFEISNGLLVHKSDNPNVNRSTETLNYIPTLFSTTTDVAKEFVHGLEANKESLMSELKINGDLYDNISKIAYGIYGQESEFGTYSGARGAYGRARDIIGNNLGKNVSYGPTQIRATSLNWEVANKYGITAIEDLDNPQNAAIATMIMLSEMYNNQINSKLKKYYQQILPVLWNNQALSKKINNGEYTSQLEDGTFSYSYLTNVENFGKELTIEQMLDEIDQCN